MHCSPASVPLLMVVTFVLLMSRSVDTQFFHPWFVDLNMFILKSPEMHTVFAIFLACAPVECEWLQIDMDCY